MSNWHKRIRSTTHWSAPSTRSCSGSGRGTARAGRARSAPTAPPASRELVCAGDPADAAGPTCRTRPAIASSALRRRRRPADRRDRSPRGRPASRCSIRDGVLVIWIELAERRPFTAEDQTLLTVLAGRLGQGLHRVAPNRPAARDRAGAAARHPRAGRPAGRLRGAVPAGHPAAAGRRRLVRRRRPRRRTDRAGRRRLRRPRPRRGHRHGSAAQRLPGAAARSDSTRPTRWPACDRFAGGLPGARCTTAFCAVLDTRTGELDLLQRRASAAHPGERADGTRLRLDGARSLPLGVVESFGDPSRP